MPPHCRVRRVRPTCPERARNAVTGRKFNNEFPPGFQTRPREPLAVSNPTRAETPRYGTGIRSPGVYRSGSKSIDSIHRSHLSPSAATEHCDQHHAARAAGPCAASGEPWMPNYRKFESVSTVSSAGGRPRRPGPQVRRFCKNRLKF